MFSTQKGTRWRSWLRHCAKSQKVAGSISDDVTGIFRWHNPSGRTMAPGVDSASNRNEYQKYFLAVKAAGAYGWQPYHLHVPTVLKSGSLNLLKPSGPVQACNGFALPLPPYTFRNTTSIRQNRFLPHDTQFVGNKPSDNSTLQCQSLKKLLKNPLV